MVETVTETKARKRANQSICLDMLEDSHEVRWEMAVPMNGTYSGLRAMDWRTFYRGMHPLL